MEQFLYWKHWHWRYHNMLADNENDDDDDNDDNDIVSIVGCWWWRWQQLSRWWRWYCRYRRICRVIPLVIGAARPRNTNLFSSHDRHFHKIQMTMVVVMKIKMTMAMMIDDDDDSLSNSTWRWKWRWQWCWWQCKLNKGSEFILSLHFDTATKSWSLQQDVDLPLSCSPPPSQTNRLVQFPPRYNNSAPVSTKQECQKLNTCSNRRPGLTKSQNAFSQFSQPLFFWEK